MNRTSCLLLAALGAVLLTGCSGSSAPSATASAKPAAAATTHVKTPWDGMLKDEAKAKAVQQTVNDYAKRQQQALKKAGG
ncbi:MAG TPA: hypothetical protein VF271_03750 [Rhodanobacteraceae bacterium]